MKIYRLLIIGAALLVSSACNDWLDVTPADSVEEDELYKDGQGYRNALNGVYRQMSQEAMYGCEMSFGLVDVMGQMYSSYNIPAGHKYRIASAYDYTDKKVKTMVESMWSKTYNSIANCNNLLSRIVDEDPGKFAGGVLEQDMIHGEALALRAFLHFDMLRLFAPARVKDDGKTYIPYFEKYPSRFEPNLTVDSVLAKVRRDMETARDLVAAFDTVPEHKNWMYTYIRFEGAGNSGSNSSNASDLFYTYRGYRMNYYAICGALARVYNYSGMHKEANDMAQRVIEAQGAGLYGPFFSFTPLDNVTTGGNRKLYDDLLFALSNSKMYDIYEAANKASRTSNDGIFTLNNYYNLMDDPSDVRGSLMQRINYYTYCNKYLKPATGSLVGYAGDMIPMIRMSEMYYIQAEYEMSIGNWAGAAQKLDKVREGRNCTIGNLRITDKNSFENELIKEANREFMCEGQLFFYYKKLGKSPGYSSLSDEQFYLPLPDNETIH